MNNNKKDTGAGHSAIFSENEDGFTAAEPMELELIRGKLRRHFGKTLKTATTAQVYEAAAMCVRDEIMEKWSEPEGKLLVYMSAEFLMGRALSNNMINLGVYDRYRAALELAGIDLFRVAQEEEDAALGNGGLGRLAACFLDSFSTLGLPAMGCGIRYEHGLFRQRILDGEQVELEDNWIDTGDVWEVEKQEEQVEIRFGGDVEEQWTEDGLKINHTHYSTVLAVPYDMPIVGYGGRATATLRLWSARAKRNLDMGYFNRGDYARAMEEKELAEVISKVLYPEDNHEAGRQLRLKQFYFFTSATMQHIVRRHKKLVGDLHRLPEFVQVQINDTHPTLAIPELMRILMDEEGFGWDEALGVASGVFNYTNHTVLSEALERWPKDMIKLLLPRIYKIIEVLNEKYCEKLWAAFPGEFDRISGLAIIAYNEVRMANLCVAVCKKVNGVSLLHGNILKTSLFRDQYVMEPDKFLAITNGITHRRWLADANPLLTSLINKTLKTDVIADWRAFDALSPYAQDPAFRESFAKVKKRNKERLAAFVYEKQGIRLNTDALFDTQAKRLHEYKRQLLKVLHIIHLYNMIHEKPGSFAQPCVFLFAAKASPGYVRAKSIIRLINAVAELVNSDPLTRDILQVVFIENYSVSAAELLIPATELSEQLSTAGKEASGTGNMKFMMNGAVTIGTMDGANIEMSGQLGAENIFTFGASAEDIRYMNKYNTYRPGELYEQNAELREALGMLIDGRLPGAGERRFTDLYHSLVFGDFGRADEYYLLYDFASYAQTFAKAVQTYSDKDEWNRMAVMNTARSGFFSSDRTIEEYDRLIWKIMQ